MTLELLRRNDQEAPLPDDGIGNTRRAPGHSGFAPRWEPRTSAPLEERVRRACLRVAPLWSLSDLVAVNPFVGYLDMPFLEARAALSRRLHADILPAGDDHEGDGLGERVFSIAARVDAAEGTDWAAYAVAQAARVCAGRFDRGVARWPSPARTLGLYAGWRALAAHDASAEARGLPGFRAWVRALPETPREALRSLVARLPGGPAEQDELLSRLLGEVAGWAGYLRQRAWHAADPVGELPELLAVRLAYDVALLEAKGLPPEVWPAPRHDDTLRRYRRLCVAERAFAQSVVSKLAARPRAAAKTRAGVQPRPSASVVFCIDVRSEILRRHLESALPAVETYGFAGFFGLPLEARDADGEATPLCPALLRPAHAVVVEPGPKSSAAVAGKLLSALRKAAAASFTYVETLGLAAVYPMLRAASGHEAHGPGCAHAHEHHDVSLEALRPEVRVSLARGIVKNLGLPRDPGRLLVLTGHDSTTTNNPQAAALACGACGGHGGGLSARVAARLLNDAEVRRALAAHGQGLADDCVAVAAGHGTATDIVRLLDRGLVPPSHQGDLHALEQAFAAAGARARAERAPHLPGLTERDRSDAAALERCLTRRSADWAELRPEWGLAGNAGFLVAPRERSRGANLEGRVFLHSYEAARDPDGAVLELILTAPVVVGSWINLQYYASTVAPDAFGSGTKTLHNIVAGVGVLLGNEGDLAQGLSLQSVHDGEKPRHEPLRLQVFVEAPRARIEGIVARHAVLQQLLDHEWITLYVLEDDGARATRYTPAAGFDDRRALRPSV